MKELKTDELLLAVRDRLKNNAAITAFCTEHYARAPKIYIGINNEDPPAPDSEDYPLIVLFYAKRHTGASVDRCMKSIGIGVAVADDDMESDGNTVTYTGLIRAAQLRELVESAIVTSHLAKVDVSGETWPDNLFPLFAENSIITFEWPKNYSRPPR